MPEWRTPLKKVEIGSGRKLIEGEDLAILSLGQVGNYAVDAANELKEEGLNLSVYDMRFVKPLDEELLHEIFQNHKFVVTVEDGCIMGGFGSAVLEFAADHDYNASIKRLGIPDRIVEHGEQPQLHRECEYDALAIKNAVYQFASNKESII